MQYFSFFLSGNKAVMIFNTASISKFQGRTNLFIVLSYHNTKLVIYWHDASTCKGKVPVDQLPTFIIIVDNFKHFNLKFSTFY